MVLIWWIADFKMILLKDINKPKSSKWVINIVGALARIYYFLNKIF